MTLAARLHRCNDPAERAARLLVAPMLLVTRVYVAWQFLKSGWLKITDWETTLFLFEEEYKVPLVSPVLAAAGGTFGELFFPMLLILGLLTRYAAAGLFAVNIMAVVSYAHVLLGEGFEAALGQHYLWGLMLLVVLVFGPGRLSIDAWLSPTTRTQCALSYGESRSRESTLLQGMQVERSNRCAPAVHLKGTHMNRLIYIIGAVVVIIAILSFFGLR